MRKFAFYKQRSAIHQFTLQPIPVNEIALQQNWLHLIRLCCLPCLYFSTADILPIFSPFYQLLGAYMVLTEVTRVAQIFSSFLLSSLRLKCTNSYATLRVHRVLYNEWEDHFKTVLTTGRGKVDCIGWNGRLLHSTPNPCFTPVSCGF